MNNFQNFELAIQQMNKVIGGMGKPENPGKPEDAGKPETAGLPEWAGQPDRSMWETTTVLEDGTEVTEISVPWAGEGRKKYSEI